MATIYTSEFYNTLLIDAVTEKLTDTPTYLFVADGTTDASSAGSIIDSTENTNSQLYQMISGKKIVDSDLYPMITRTTWTANTVYDQYQDDVDLSAEQFFVINSRRAVYKCIFNNYGAYSTEEPTSLDRMATKLSDGYIWQFMYRLTVNQLQNLCTDELLAVIPDANTVSNAVAGTIDYIIVEDGGSEYLHHNGTVQSVVNTTVLSIETSASAVANSYANSSIYISSGPGIGQISKIANYVSNSSGRFVTTSTALSNVTISSTYEIAPTIAITGDGSGATARAVMEDGVIDTVDVLNGGSNYTYATIGAYAQAGFGSGANLTSAVSPHKGHGSDVVSELRARHLLVTVTLEGTELDTIRSEPTFSKYGLATNIKQAANTAAAYTANTFNNTVEIEYTPVVGTFNKGDTIVNGSAGSTGEAVVLFANTSVIIAQATNRSPLNANNIVSQTGAVGTVSSVSLPNVYTRSADVLSITSAPTVTRTDDDKEIVNMIIKF